MRSDMRDDRRYRLILALLWVILCSATCFAHPMGNFSVNHYSKISIGQKSIEILYLVDMAEIPTYQQMRQFDVTPKADDPSAGHYLDKQEPTLRAGLSLESDGQAVQLETISRRVMFAEGAGGLPTMKIGFVFRGKVHGSGGAHRLSYSDNNFPGHAGWKEIVVLGNGAEVLNSSAPGMDRSQELTSYSSDALNSPPQQLSASVSYRTTPVGLEEKVSISAPETSASGFAPATRTSGKRAIGPVSRSGGKQSPPVAVTSSNLKKAPDRRDVLAPAVAPLLPAGRVQNTPRSRFTALISTQSKLSLWFLFSAALIAAGLGALHALEPGHGKTIVASYLVGSRGTSRHALLLGVVVTAVHTSGVFLLGAVTLYASRYIVPEQLYPWLGVISGLSVVGLGIFIFLRHLDREKPASIRMLPENGTRIGSFPCSNDARSETAASATSASTPTGRCPLAARTLHPGHHRGNRALSGGAGGTAQCILACTGSDSDYS